jgi:hypothetical protein
MAQINLFAVLAAALSTFAIGGLWYSPVLFYKPWLRANGFSEADVQKGSAALIFALAFVFSLVMSANLAALLAAPDTTMAWGIGAGALAAVWVVLGMAVVALFERRPWSYILINGGYWVVSFLVMGAILGAWR